MANKLINPIVQIRYQNRSKSEMYPALPVNVAGNQTTNVGRESFTFRKNYRKGEDPCVVILDSKGSIHYLYANRPITVKLHGSSYTFVLDNDIAASDSSSFYDFIKWSFGVHVFMMIAFAFYSVVAPKTDKKISVNIDQSRIEKLKEKIALAKKPKPKPKPKKKEIVKLEKPKPKKIAKRKPKPRVRKQPKPKKIVKRAPPPKPRRAVSKAPSKIKRSKRLSKRPVIAKKRFKKRSSVSNAKKRAAAARKRRVAAKAKMAKSLNFLSSSPGKFAVKTSVYKKVNKKYKAQGGGRLKKGGAYLNKLATTSLKEGPITTKGSRNIAGVNLVTGSDLREAKSLNRVQARVSIANLRNTGNFGGGYMDGGLSVSGKGRLDESAIMKAIQRHLQKLQYCYEKALLRNPSLAGNIMMGWSISGGGRASSVKVVRSQLKNAKLHGCISSEIARIRFPKPKGGSVRIKYPFSFSSSNL